MSTNFLAVRLAIDILPTRLEAKASIFLPSRIVLRMERKQKRNRDGHARDGGQSEEGRVSLWRELSVTTSARRCFTEFAVFECFHPRYALVQLRQSSTGIQYMFVATTRGKLTII